MKTLAPLSLLVLGLLGSGCLAVVAAGAAAGYVQYDNNRMWREFVGEPSPIYTATHAAAVAQGYRVHEDAGNDPTRRTLTGEDIVITLERYPRGRMRVSVRIGTFSTDEHRRRASLLLEEIGTRLGV